MHRMLCLMSLGLLPLMSGCIRANDAPDAVPTEIHEGPRIVALSSAATATLDLQGYRVLAERRGQSAPATLQPGQKVIECGHRECVIASTQMIRSSDIKRVDWSPWTQFVRPSGDMGGGPSLRIVLKQPAAASCGSDPVILTSGVVPVGLPSPLRDQCVISVEFAEFPSERQQALLPYLKGLPGSEGLALGGTTVKVLPGLARVHVRAHFPDGSPSRSLSCQRFEPWINNGTGTYGKVVPTVTMGDSEFTVMNVAPGTWRYVMAGRDFAMEKACWKVLEIKAGETLELDVIVHRGATVSGRVVEAEGQQPIAAVDVSGRGSRAMTDAEGRYQLVHVDTEDAKLFVRDERYVAQEVRLGRLRDAQQFSAPDIRLQRGGFITGSIPRQPEMTSDLWWFGYVRPDLPEPQKSMYSAFVDKQKDRFTFRMGPLPAGTYDLDAFVACSDKPKCDPRRRWDGQAKSIRAVVGQETKDVTISIQPKAAQGGAAALTVP